MRTNVGYERGMRIAGKPALARAEWLVPFGYALSLIAISANAFEKYIGGYSLVAYIVAVLLAVFALWRYGPRVIAHVSERQALWLTVAFILALTAIFVVAYPLANAGLFGPDNDRNESISVGTARLLQGEYPYYGTTPGGAAISQLPGALFLTVPFFLLGDGAYQVIFWTIAFLIVVRTFLLDNRHTLLVMVSVFALAPKVGQEFVAGSDLVANALYILIALILLLESAAGSSLAARVGAALFLGLTLASRLNFVLLLPLVYAGAARKAGRRSETVALFSVGLAGLTCALLILPFWRYDPAGFSPFLTSTGGKLAWFDIILPYSGILIPAATGLIALWLAFSQNNARYVTLFRNCAIIQAVPVVAGIVLPFFETGRFLWAFGSRYGFFFIFFAALAFWLAVQARQVSRSGALGRG
ncbi:MAG: hypothetical protein ACRDIB_10500 [Ardenticatenaceae bacterium]